MTIRNVAGVSSVALALVLCAAGVSSADDSSILTAKAKINSCADGSAVGTAVLVERPSAEGVKVVDVFLTIDRGQKALVAGKHGVHIHEIGNCTPCSAAGSHLDLGPHGHNVPVTENHPFHSGDLVNVSVASSGKGFAHTTTSRVALSAGNLSLFDADGSALVIHALPDLYCPDPTDPNCAGGGRAACGILQLIN
jgi:superoxide dismutase, Cu-Zn family